MSSLTHNLQIENFSASNKPKFLLDENVRIELFRFLKSKKFDVKQSPKSAKDNWLAALSLKEKRVLVTNDEDFTSYGKSDIFSVVWLRITQSDCNGLIFSFIKLLSEFSNFSGKLIILNVGKWTEFPLGQDIFS